MDNVKGITRTFRVWGQDGHRQRISFGDSSSCDFSENGNVRVIEVDCEDKTGTNDYVIVRVTRNTAEEAEREFWAQESDGIFENSRHGKIEELTKEGTWVPAAQFWNR